MSNDNHDSFNLWVDNKDIKLYSHNPMFATTWPDFHKFLQVITLDEYNFFINSYYLLFKVNNFFNMSQNRHTTITHIDKQIGVTDWRYILTDRLEFYIEVTD